MTMKCKFCKKEFDHPASGEFTHTVVSWANEDKNGNVSGSGYSTKRFAPTCPYCNFPIYKGNTQTDYPSAKGHLPPHLKKEKSP